MVFGGTARDLPYSLSRDLLHMRHIPASREQSVDGNVLVNRIPMNASLAEFVVLTLLCRGVEQARELHERYTNGATVGEFHRERIRVEDDFKGRKTHYMSPQSIQNFRVPHALAHTMFSR